MGEVLIVSPDDILPSQDYLDERSLYAIATSIKSSVFHNLPPRPIVREYNGRYIAIDGHNLLAVYSYLGMKSTVHLAESHEDFIREPDADKRNKELQEKFDISVPETRRVQDKGISTMADLVKDYNDLLKNIFNH